MTTYPDLGLLIDGKWLRPGESIGVINPATERELARLPIAGPAELSAAIAAAQRGFSVWRATAPDQRARIISRAAALLRERVDAVAMASTLEQGKPIAQARLEVLRACDIIEWDANEGRRLYGRIIPSAPGLRHSVIREPLGVVAAFSPWNFPVSSPARKVAGALAAGCSIILKASEETPAGAVQLAQCFIDAGLPPGVLNLVFGDPEEISRILIVDSAVRLVTFTGSVPVGKSLASLAGAHMKPAIMELGGHGPVIVCDDANPDVVAAASVGVKARNAGQVCVAPTRFFVHEHIHDRFVAAAREAASALTVGDPLDLECRMGPLANRRRLEAVEDLVRDALERGATLISGGRRLEGYGYRFPLTILTDIPEDARAMVEEPFGPLMLIQPFRDLDDAITLANALPFGLAGYAFTDSAQQADRIASRLECGNLSINNFVASLAETPFGGVKESGYGREGGVEGLSCYTYAKNISHAMTAPF